jgi:hypothetical protein
MTRSVLDAIERRLAPLDREILLDEWRLAVGRPAPNSARTQERRRRLLAEPGLRDRIARFRADTPPAPVARRLELLERALLESQISQAPEIVRIRARVERTIAAFRPRWSGRRVGRAVVRRQARTNPDRSERERAYRAEAPLYGPLEAEARALTAARNERARAFGYRSFPEFRLSFEGSSVARLEGLLDAAVRYVPAEMRRRREAFEEQTGERGWYPWDVGFAQELTGGLPDAAFPGATMYPTVVAAVRKWGFPARAFRFRVDRHDLASGGLTLAPDPPRDVRIVIHPSAGFRPYLVLFHEVGHALNSASIRQSSHLLRWHENLPGFAGLSEGEGRFFEQISTSAAWLGSRPGLDAAQVARAVDDGRRMPLVAIAHHAVWIRQELELFRRPSGGDPSDVGRRLARRLSGFDDYRPLPFADSFSLNAPMYAPSYFFAELLRPHLTAAALAEVGGALWPNPRVGPWLVDRWFRDGSSYDWVERLERMTGRRFDARPFNAEARAAVRP